MRGTFWFYHIIRVLAKKFTILSEMHTVFCNATQNIVEFSQKSLWYHTDGLRVCATFSFEPRYPKNKFQQNGVVRDAGLQGVEKTVRFVRPLSMTPNLPLMLLGKLFKFGRVRLTATAKMLYTLWSVGHELSNMLVVVGQIREVVSKRISLGLGTMTTRVSTGSIVNVGILLH